jgi:hypothetical protein
VPAPGVASTLSPYLTRRVPVSTICAVMPIAVSVAEFPRRRHAHHYALLTLFTAFGLSRLFSPQSVRVTTIFSKSASRLSQSNVLLPTIEHFLIFRSFESARFISRLLHSRRDFPFASRARPYSSLTRNSSAESAATRLAVVRLPPHRPKAFHSFNCLGRTREVASSTASA